MRGDHPRRWVGPLVGFALAVATMLTGPASASPGTEVAQSATASVPNGNLEAVVYPLHADVPPSTAQVQGWALDPDTPDRSVEIDVYSGGTFAGWGYADQSRGDVGAHGFSIYAVLPTGAADACAYAIDTTDPSAHRFLGCVTAAPGGLPFGNLDAVVRVPLPEGALTPQGWAVDPVTGQVIAFAPVSVQGWALDPDTAQPLQVSILSDGMFVDEQTALLPRPDVAAAFPAYAGTGRGFSTVLFTGGATHTYCAYALNVGFGVNQLLGCFTTTVGPSP